jgi:hypothetical protein
MTVLEQSIDAVDFLINAADLDPDVAAPLMRCRNSLAALSWERFRVRHEVLSRQATAKKLRIKFVERHQHYR